MLAFINGLILVKKEKAALKIQKVWRGYIVRKKAAEEKQRLEELARAEEEE